jgi:3',5'-cyclic AMP phosphodiesterase CpdA
MATGLLGRNQRITLELLLSQLAADNLFRVLMIHHPPVTSKGRWAARLRDSKDLLAIIKKRGVDLVLHGHDHRHATIWIDGPQGKIPAIGVPSASAAARGHNHPAAYNLFSISRDGNAWRCDQSVRGFGNGAGIEEIKTERII